MLSDSTCCYLFHQKVSLQGLPAAWAHSNPVAWLLSSRATDSPVFFLVSSQIMLLTDPEVESSLLISLDEGASYQKHSLAFDILSLLFHPEQEDWILAYSHDQKVAWSFQMAWRKKKLERWRDQSLKRIRDVECLLFADHTLASLVGVVRHISQNWTATHDGKDFILIIITETGGPPIPRHKSEGLAADSLSEPMGNKHTHVMGSMWPCEQICPPNMRKTLIHMDTKSQALNHTFHSNSLLCARTWLSALLSTTDIKLASPACFWNTWFSEREAVRVWEVR